MIHLDATRIVKTTVTAACTSLIMIGFETTLRTASTRRKRSHHYLHGKIWVTINEQLELIKATNHKFICFNITKGCIVEDFVKRGLGELKEVKRIRRIQRRYKLGSA